MDGQIAFKEIGSNDLRYGFLEEIMEKSFPECERPDAEVQRQRLDREPCMHCCCIEHAGDDAPIGLLTYWEWDDLIYIEHFAIRPSLRGKGYGEAALRLFLSDRNCNEPGQAVNASLKPVVLEVEHPYDLMSKKRIDFYCRNGLLLWPDMGYRQPPYRQGGTDVAMLIMGTAEIDASNYAMVRDRLYRDVYKAQPKGV